MILELFVEHVDVLIIFDIGKGMEDRLIEISSPFEIYLTLCFLKQINSRDKVGASFTLP